MKKIFKIPGAYKRPDINRNYSVKVISAVLALGVCMSVFALPDAKANYESLDNHNIEMLVPLGNTAGVKLISEGVMIVGLSAVAGENGNTAPASSAGLLEGDIIQYIGDQKIISSEHVTDIIRNTNGEPVTIRATRNGKLMQFAVTPAKCKADGCYKLGAWIRDSMAGIGTLTFYHPESKTFGALGHGVNDIDTAQLIPIKKGSIMNSTVVGIKKGEAGKPGELKGEFDFSGDLGELYANTNTGIYGKMPDCELVTDRLPIPVARNDEIKTGKAGILSNIEGSEVSIYDVEIVKIFPYTNAASKNMMIKVTDEDLLAKTGGIVQGMSGSPIIQNGKIIGAVTHVLVNDPQRGYGIFISNMLKDAFWEKTKIIS